MEMEAITNIKIFVLSYNFDCSDKPLTTLEGVPKYVTRDFYCSNNKVKFTEEYVRSIINIKEKVFI